MKNQTGSPNLGSRGKSLCISVLFFMLLLLFILCFKSSFVDNLCTRLKPAQGRLIILYFLYQALVVLLY